MAQYLDALSSNRFEHMQDRQRSLILWGLQASLAVLILFIAIIVAPSIGTAPNYPLVGFVLMGLLLSAALTWWRYLTLASIITLILLAVWAILPSLGEGSRPQFEGVLGALTITLGGLLLGQRGTLTACAGMLFAVALTNFTTAVPVSSNAFLDEVALAVAYVAITLATLGFLRLSATNRAEGEAISNAERAKLSNLILQITEIASQRDGLDDAMAGVLDLILAKYPQFHHAQIYMIEDDGVQAKLLANTGDISADLNAQDFAIAVGSLSVVGQATLRGEPIFTTVGQKDTINAIHRLNPLLPQTVAELAVPMKIEERIFGALDLHSREQIDISEAERTTFQILASSLSLVIDNIRQFEKSQESVRENQQLAEQARSALREVERLNQRLIGRAWNDYLRNYQQQIGLDVDFEREQAAATEAWTATLTQAVLTNDVIQTDHIIAIPLRVRGHTVGALEFEAEAGEFFTSEDIELLQDIGERFGLAVENMRLVDESQRVAQREILINEVASRVQSAKDVEATLVEAARSLNETLGAGKVAIRLGVPKAE